MKEKKIVVYGILNTGVWKKRYNCCRDVINPIGICKCLTSMDGGGLIHKVCIRKKKK